MKCAECERPVLVKVRHGAKRRRGWHVPRDGAHDLCESCWRQLLDRLRSQRFRPEESSMSDFDDFSDLDSFGGDEFTPQPAIRASIDTLADGAYDFEVLDAELSKARNGETIFTLGLRANRGAVVQHTYWLTRQVAVNRLAYDLGVLGFNTDGWGKSVKLSTSIVHAAKDLPGVKFRGTKSSRFVPGTNGKKDATYHDLNVSGRIGGTPMPEESVAF